MKRYIVNNRYGYDRDSIILTLGLGVNHVHEANDTVARLIGT